MDAETVLTKALLTAFFLFLEVYVGRFAVEGFRTGLLRVPMRGGERTYSRKSQSAAYWFWMVCMLGAVLVTGPLAMGAILFGDVH